MERWAAVRPGHCDSEVVVRRAEHDNLPPGFIETSHFQSAEPIQGEQTARAVARRGVPAAP